MTRRTDISSIAAQATSMPAWLRMCFKANYGLNAVLKYSVGAMLAGMVAIVFLQIAVRFVLPRFGVMVSVPWSEELARYLMVWCIFLGAAVASRSGDLICVDALVGKLTEPWGWRLKMLAHVITLGFLAVLVRLGWRWTDFGEMESSTAMNLPMSWVYLSLPVGAGLMILNIATRLAEDVVRQRSHVPDAVPTADELPDLPGLAKKSPPV